MIDLDGTSAYLTHTMASPGTYPFSQYGWVKSVYNGLNQIALSECRIAAGRGIRSAIIQNSSGSGVSGQSFTSWGGGPAVFAGGNLGDATPGEPMLVVHNSVSSITLYTLDNPAGLTNSDPNGTPGDFALSDTIIVGGWYVDGAYGSLFSGAVGEIARWNAVLDAADFAALSGGAAPETVKSGSIYDVWPLNPAGSTGSSVTGTITGLINGRTLTVNGTVVKSALTHPVTRTGLTITGPTGGAGAGSSTSSVAENTVTGPTFSTSLAPGGGYPTITGVDASLFTLVTLTSTSWRVDFTSAPDFEAPGDSGANNVYNFTFNASATVSQTHALTVTDVVDTDTTVPVLTGSVTPSLVTQTTATITWPVGSDNVAVTGYEYNLNGGSFTDAGNVLTANLTGLTANTAHAVTVRAYDAAGNRSTPAISGNFTTLAVIPVISVQPTNQTVTAPTAATFIMTATGTSPTSQWQRQPQAGGGYVNVAGGLGGTTNSYTTPGTSTVGGNANNGDTYRVQVSNSGGTVTSNVVTLTVNAGTDITAPVFNAGSLVASSIALTSYTLTWPTATDNVAVTGYEYSLNAGATWTNNGTLTTVNITGRSPGTTDNCRVRAFDAGGNRSTTLSVAVTLLTTLVTTQIISNGSGLPLANTLFSYSFFPGGRIGNFSGITSIEGTVTSNGSGVCAVYNLPPVLGVLVLAFRATSGTSDSTTDKVYYQAVTPAV